jgi:N-acetyl sugar amidotransferase
MDTTDSEIEFDANGICNHCRRYYEIASKKLFDTKEGERKLKEIFNSIKEDGKNKKYDCILGVSGGLDSSYVAYIAKRFGLRVLLVHVDNGWNSEISEKNIERILKKTNFDIYRYKIDWEEFKDLQRAYFKSSVVDIEVITDHAVSAVIYRLAIERKIKYILAGGNIVSEAIMPRSWNYIKGDARNIKAIHKRFGTRKLKNFPLLSILKRGYYKNILGIKTIRVLDYINYNRSEAMKILEKEFDWEYYGKKHYESIFTRFYQGYILPRKFGIDKRKAHLSNLICSYQITRKEALEEIKKEIYPPELLEKDKKYVINKLGFSEEEFEKFMKNKPKSHLDFPNAVAILKFGIFLKRILKPF